MKLWGSRIAAVGFALLSGATGVLASCNWIVDAGGYSVGDSSRGPDSGGMGDANGSGHPDTDGLHDASDATQGTFDAPSDRVANGDAGVDLADTGSQTDGVSPDVVPTCGQGLPSTSDFTQLVSQCVLVVSCDPYFFNVNISSCITNDYLHSALALSCLSRIASCADFYTCQGWRYATSAECPAGNGSVSCATSDGGAVAIECADAGSGIVTNCGQFGEPCSLYSTPDGGQGVGCVSPVTCAGTSGSFACSSNYLYTCINGAAFGQSCATIQSTCETLGSTTDCFYNAGTCSSPNTDSCDGGTLSVCTATGRSFTYNCARAGLSCSLDDAGAGWCVAPSCPIPPPSSCTEQCTGSTLSVCVGGAPYSIDCTQYGFTKCATATDSSGTAYAYCL